jgi:uncharacterized membrane protein
MTALARPLEMAGAGVSLLILAVLATGGWRIVGLPLTRAEDLVVLLAAIVALRLLVAPVTLPAVRPAGAVAAGATVYALLMGFVVVTRHLALQTHALDLGYYVQVVWSIASGHGAHVTLPAMHAWGDHLSPILYMFVPLGWLVSSGTALGTALLAAQTLVFAAGAVAVYRYALRRLAPRANAGRLAAGFALLYLVNPSLHGINIRDIHPQAFAIALLPAAALAFDAGRYGWCAVALLLTLGGREDCTIAVVGFGIWLALARGRWALGAAVGGASVVLLFADITWVMPYFRGSPYPHLQRYPHLGSSLGEILLTLLARPWQWFGVVVSAKKIVYLLAMLAPFGFLPLLAPLTLAGALAGLSMNLLSLDPILFNYRSQYQAFILPFLALAAVDGYAWLCTWTDKRPRVRLLAPGAALALGFIASAALTARTVNDLTVTRWMPTADQRAAYALMREIPVTAVVSTNERLVSHLATRREISIFPKPREYAPGEYVLERERVIAGTPAHLFPAEEFEVEARAASWVLLRRRR